MQDTEKWCEKCSNKFAKVIQLKHQTSFKIVYGIYIDYPIKLGINVLYLDISVNITD